MRFAVLSSLALQALLPGRTIAFVGLPQPRTRFGWLAVTNDDGSSDNPTIVQDLKIEEVSPSSKISKQSSKPALTSVVLKISYDGRCFSGWSAANDDPNNNNKTVAKDAPRSGRRRRNQGMHSLLSGRPRSVEGVLKSCFAKLYGNVDPQQIVIEGVSRTDKGVHALSMVALVYCLSPDLDLEMAQSARTIPGKRLPHPWNSTDTSCFCTLPMDTTRLGYTINRMLPPDVAILQVAEMPNVRASSSAETDLIPFHPTISSESKTYQYHLAVAPRPNPLTRRTSWYVGNHLDLDRLQQAAQLLQGNHDFGAFRGAARGSTDKRKYAAQSTTCHVMDVNVTVKASDMWGAQMIDAPGSSQNIIVTIRADRFLYKMIRFMVGAMVGVATGVMELDDLQTMLDTQDRVETQFKCAPPEGLFLTNVEFQEEIAWTTANQ
uniref:tRNA pseudouridine synthase n=1 Tax=Entomoneis paludosa TaxID=265537 RepID=A0A7S2VDE7_9STRA|mmetsp:Transcript_17232/g.35695  ORF Transcript_17232/g.35695 Transcript_17232/m.35695 type:complete len:434 (+) Transcript_17232:145-1446(+)